DCLLWMSERVEVRRCLRQTGEQRGLRKSQMPGRLREVCLRRRLDPVGAVPVEDLVDVRVENPALGLLARKLDREARLGCFAAERLRGLLDVQVARKLLGDRRAPLNDMAGTHVRKQRAYDARVVERAVLPETAVLDRNRCAWHPLAHVAEIDRLPVLL